MQARLVRITDGAAGAHPYQVSDAEYDLFARYFVSPEPGEGFHIVVHTP